MPWVQPWGTAAAKAPLAMPKNAATGRQLFRDQCADPLGGGDRARFPGPGLGHFPPGAVARRQCPQGRARHHRRLCRPLHSRRREEAGARDRRGSAGHPVPEALHRLQPGAMRRSARGSLRSRAATGARPDRAHGRGADQGDRHRLPHRRQPRLLRPRARLCAGSAAASLFRADQLAPHRAARARSRQRRPAPAEPRSLRLLRLQEVCVRGAGRRDERRLLLRLARHRRRPCAMPTISARGSRCCARTIAPSSAPPRRRARPPISSSAFFPATTNAPPRHRMPNRRRRDSSAAGLGLHLWRSRPSRKAGSVRMRISGSAGLRRPRGRGLRRSS